MNLTADIAVVAIAALALTDTVLNHRFRMKVADRLRVVNPAKAQQQDAQAPAVEPVATMRRTG